ncbi:hypothetical protein N7504_010653 [Penicillium tannophilum]|nr:hypothetical protein N7504_010653 [Penicillium tannophilum]
MKRISRACVRCRRHKAKCILEKSGHLLKPPCQKCIQAGVDCVLATSNRGGYRRRKARDLEMDRNSAEQTSASPQDLSVMEESAYWSPETAPLVPDAEAGHGHVAQPGQGVDIRERASLDDTFASTDLHSTSDALNILSQIAGGAVKSATVDTDTLRNSTGQYTTTSENGLLDYYLVRSRILTPAQVLDLLDRFATTCHPFYPIVPGNSLKSAFISETARREPHLLTAMITIGAKDIPNGEHVLETCAQYMQTLISGIVAGKKCGIEAVEALLLLAEWEPQCGLPESSNLGCGQEDMAAWMHIGLAVRLAYSLKLDRTVFRSDPRRGGSNASRERLAWAACYLSDRQISVRIGRPFACRGLEPSIAYGRHGFPVIESENPAYDDFSSVFQARLELTQIFTNVHEVLYCNQNSSTQMMLFGNYAACLDDFRGSIATWNSVWGSLTCSPNVKILMQLSYEYLRLYANAFAFQAATLRTLSPNVSSLDRETDHIKGPGSLPEARFMYESIDAAKSLLTIVNNYISLTDNLNKFPIRFPLYCVNAAVFLYKIWTLNVISNPERISVRRLISDTIKSLRKGTTRSSEICARYAYLLEVLWDRADQRLDINDASPGFENQTRPVPRIQEFTPNLQDAFSWLDLEAIGNFVWGDPPQNGCDDFPNVQPSVNPLREAINWNDLDGFAGQDFSRVF